MMTRERELLQQALDALDRAISDDRAYIRECKDAAEAIRAHLAAQPAPAAPAAPVVPLTDKQILSMWRSSKFRGNGGQADWFCEGIRAAEAHHGITGASK